MSPSLINTLVRASAVWNFLLAAGAFQAGATALRQKEQSSAYFNLMTGAFLAFTAVVLFLAARSLDTRASIVFWESFLRIGAAMILLWVGRGVLGDGKACFLALTDLAWAAVYQAGLMSAFGKSYWQLLCDL